MCISYLIANNTFYKPRGMRIAWCDNKLFKEFHVATFRKYDTLNITGNSSHDAVQIKNLNDRLKKLLLKNDVQKGVIVVFGNKSSYAEFINVLDICYQSFEKGLVFAPYGNKLYIGHVHLPPVPAQTISSFFGMGNDVIREDIPPPAPDFFSIDNFKALFLKIFQFLKSYWPSALAFLLMIIFTIFKRMRYINLKDFRSIA